MAEFSARGGDGICVRDTVNTDFMEGVLPVSSTGFAPGSIYGSTFTLSNSQYGVCRAPLVQFCRAPPSTPLNFVRLRLFWNSRHRSSKDRSWSMRGPGCYATKGTLSIVVLMSLIEGLLPAQSCVVFIMHLDLARHTALCRDAAPLRAIVGSCRA